MAECRRQTETDSGDTAGTCSTVFVDTSLDTHLAMVVSNYDTIFDLKRKITLEHLRCFPRIGEIKIQALKVKRKGNFYHLSDSMLVSSAFEVGKRIWFVSVDAFCLKQQSLDKNSCKSEASNPLALICLEPKPSGELSLQRLLSTQCTDQKIPDAGHSSPRESKDIFSDNVADKRSNIKLQEKYEAITNGAKSLAAGGTEVSCDTEFKRKYINEEDSRSGFVAKKKRKIESTENSRYPSETGTAEKKKKKKKKKRRRKKTKHEPLVQQVGERSCNENVEINNEDFGNEKHSELVQEVVEKNNVTCQSIGTDMHVVDSVNGKENSNLPEVDGELNGSSKRKKKKKKKKRVKKVALWKKKFPGIEEANDAVGDTALPVVHSGTDDHRNDETMKDKSMLSHPESTEISEQRPIDGSSLGAVKGDNMNVSEPERLPQANTDVENKEPADSANLLEAEGAIESMVKVGGTKKEVKKVKKSAQTAPTSVINSHSNDLMKKGERFFSRIEKEASSQQKPIDREHENMTENEMDLLPLTQVNQNKENVDSVDEKSGKKLGKGEISTTLDLLTEFQNREQEPAVESVPRNEVEKHQYVINTGSLTKKRAKRKHNSAEKILPDLPNNEVGVDEPSRMDPPFNTSNEPESIKTRPANHLTRSDLELGKNSGTKPDNQEQMEDYFVPGQEKNESAAIDKLEEAARPDREMKSKKNKRKPALPSIDTSSELQNKEKPNDEDYNLVPPPKKSLDVSGRLNGTRKNQTGVDKYNASVGKGPAKNSGEVNAVRKSSSEAKTGSQPEITSLPTPCAIFSEDSRDSCIDEKKNINSDTSTRTPSDDSSSSGSSMDSLRNGSSGPDRKEDPKNITKSQSAGPKNIPMNMILRSSSRFKKAKLLAL